jgi:hypothetical protein
VEVAVDEPGDSRVPGQVAGQPVPPRHQVRGNQRTDARVAQPPPDERKEEIDPLAECGQPGDGAVAGDPQPGQQLSDLPERREPGLVAEPDAGLDPFQQQRAGLRVGVKQRRRVRSGGPRAQRYRLCAGD